jgi:hypothetical protein
MDGNAEALRMLGKDGQIWPRMSRLRHGALTAQKTKWEAMRRTTGFDKLLI